MRGRDGRKLTVRLAQPTHTLPAGSLLLQASRQFLNYVAHTLGWRVAFLIVAALSALALLGVWLTVPQGVKTALLNGASWRRVLTR